MSGDIYVSDLSVAARAPALADLPMRDTWYKLPYETPDCCGVMLRSFPEAPSLKIHIPLEAKGAYAVYLGIHYSMSERDDIEVRFGITPEFARLNVRLENDESFSLVLPEIHGRKSELAPDRDITANDITECF